MLVKKLSMNLWALLVILIWCIISLCFTVNAKEEVILNISAISQYNPVIYEDKDLYNKIHSEACLATCYLMVRRAVGSGSEVIRHQDWVDGKDGGASKIYSSNPGGKWQNELDNIKRSIRNGAPVIIGTNSGLKHWVLIVGFRDNTLLVNDPANGAAGIALTQATRYNETWTTRFLKGVQVSENAVGDKQIQVQIQPAHPLQPASDAQINGIVNFSWQDPNGAEVGSMDLRRYALEVTDSSGLMVLESGWIKDTNWNNQGRSPLPPGQYTWTVRIGNGTSESARTSPQTFTVASQTIKVPNSLQSTPNGGTVGFVWQDPNGAEVGSMDLRRYALEVTDSSGLMVLESGWIKDTNWNNQGSQPLPQGKYTWTVRIGNGTSESARTSPQAFTITNQVEVSSQLWWPSPSNFLERFCLEIMKHEGWKLGSLSVRNNNPGNLRRSNNIPNKPGEGGFVRFETPQAGWEALVWDVRQKCIGNTVTGLNGESTILDFFKVWAPGSDNNDPVGYANIVAAALGLSVNTRLKEIYNGGSIVAPTSQKPLEFSCNSGNVAKGQPVVQKVTGATPGGHINLYWIPPGQPQQGPVDKGATDGNGNFEFTWDTNTASYAGTYTSWVVDGATGRESNRIQVTINSPSMQVPNSLQATPNGGTVGFVWQDPNGAEVGSMDLRRYALEVTDSSGRLILESGWIKDTNWNNQGRSPLPPGQYTWTVRIGNGTSESARTSPQAFTIAPQPAQIAPVFSGQLISVSPPVSIQPGQSAKCTVVVRNTGNQTWKQNGQSMVALGTTNPQDRIPGFVREDTVTHQPSGWVTPNRVSLQQSEVPPNGTGTFEFWYSAPQGMSPGSYQEAFNLVADGQSPGWFQGLSIVWPVTVSPPPAASIHDYVAEFVGESGFLTLQPGQTGTVWFKFRNKGTAVWKQSGQYVVRLGTRNPDNRPSTFFMSGWLEPSHPCMLQEPEVPSGQIGTFSFQVTAPNTPGQYEEHFAPVVDGLGWVEGLPPVFTTITVQPPPGYVDPDASHYHAQYITQNPYPTLRRGEAYRFQVQLRNNGTATWIREKVNLGTDRPQDRVPGFVRESADGSPSGWISPNRIVMQEQQVPPGGTATFVFYMRVPDSMAPGSYQEYFRLVADGITWMEDIGIYWTITVAP